MPNENISIVSTLSVRFGNKSTVTCFRRRWHALELALSHALQLFIQATEKCAFLSGVNDIGAKGTVRRTRVCNLEIWCECFGKDPSSLSRSESNNLTAALTKLGWTRQEKKERVQLYGPQVVFVPD